MHLGWFPETVQYAQKARSWFVALGDDDDDAVWSQPLKQRLSVNTFHSRTLNRSTASTASPTPFHRCIKISVTVATTPGKLAVLETVSLLIT